MTEGSDYLPHTILEIIQEVTKKDDSMPSPCIFRVPEKLRKVNESAYTPQLVSIGPLHSNKEHLKSPMEDIKKYYANVLFWRMKTANHAIDIEQVLKKCVEKIKESLDKAKECKLFAEKVDARDVTMLVIDGCFILELLYRYHHRYKPTKPKTSNKNPHHTETSNNPNSNKPRKDFCFDSALARVAIRRDLLLLENQLPFFVLEDLFDLTVPTIWNPTVDTIPKPLASLSEYLLSYFGNMMNPSEQGGENDLKPKICEGVSHILHFLYNQYCHPQKQDSPKTDFNNYNSMPPASELEYAGVKFEDSTKTGGRDPPFMVKFEPPHGLFWFCHRASFKIPTLLISGDTETLLRNLIAFEQCYTGPDYNTGPDPLDFYFTSYATLMDRLVNTEKDVKVLEKAEVIRSCLSDRVEVSAMLNSLCKEIVHRDNFCFVQTCNQAAMYSKCCWPKSLAYLRRTYFANPWTFIAFLVGFFAFVMSVIQFIRSFRRSGLFSQNYLLLPF